MRRRERDCLVSQSRPIGRAVRGESPSRRRHPIAIPPRPGEIRDVYSSDVREMQPTRVNTRHHRRPGAPIREGSSLSGCNRGTSPQVTRPIKLDGLRAPTDRLSSIGGRLRGEGWISAGTGSIRRAPRNAIDQGTHCRFAARDLAPSTRNRLGQISIFVRPNRPRSIRKAIDREITLASTP